MWIILGSVLGGLILGGILLAIFVFVFEDYDFIA